MAGQTEDAEQQTSSLWPSMSADTVKGIVTRKLDDIVSTFVGARSSNQGFLNLPTPHPGAFSELHNLSLVFPRGDTVWLEQLADDHHRYSHGLVDTIMPHLNNETVDEDICRHASELLHKWAKNALQLRLLRTLHGGFHMFLAQLRMETMGRRQFDVSIYNEIISDYTNRKHFDETGPCKQWLDLWVGTFKHIYRSGDHSRVWNYVNSFANSNGQTPVSKWWRRRINDIRFRNLLSLSIKTTTVEITASLTNFRARVLQLSDQPGDVGFGHALRGVVKANAEIIDLQYRATLDQLPKGTMPPRFDECNALKLRYLLPEAVTSESSPASQDHALLIQHNWYNALTSLTNFEKVFPGYIGVALDFTSTMDPETFIMCNVPKITTCQGGKQPWERHEIMHETASFLSILRMIVEELLGVKISKNTNHKGRKKRKNMRKAMAAVDSIQGSATSVDAADPTLQQNRDPKIANLLPQSGGGVDRASEVAEATVAEIYYSRRKPVPINQDISAQTKGKQKEGSEINHTRVAATVTYSIKGTPAAHKPQLAERKAQAVTESLSFDSIQDVVRSTPQPRYEDGKQLDLGASPSTGCSDSNNLNPTATSGNDGTNMYEPIAEQDLETACVFCRNASATDGSWPWQEIILMAEGLLEWMAVVDTGRDSACLHKWLVAALCPVKPSADSARPIITQPIQGASMGTGSSSQPTSRHGEVDNTARTIAKPEEALPIGIQEAQNFPATVATEIPRSKPISSSARSVTTCVPDMAQTATPQPKKKRGKKTPKQAKVQGAPGGKTPIIASGCQYITLQEGFVTDGGSSACDGNSQESPQNVYTGATSIPDGGDSCKNTSSLAEDTRRSRRSPTPSVKEARKATANIEEPATAIRTNAPLLKEIPNHSSSNNTSSSRTSFSNGSTKPTGKKRTIAVEPSVIRGENRCVDVNDRTTSSRASPEPNTNQLSAPAPSIMVLSLIPNRVGPSPSIDPVVEESIDCIGDGETKVASSRRDTCADANSSKPVAEISSKPKRGRKKGFTFNVGEFLAFDFTSASDNIQLGVDTLVMGDLTSPKFHAGTTPTPANSDRNDNPDHTTTGSATDGQNRASADLATPFQTQCDGLDNAIRAFSDSWRAIISSWSESGQLPVHM